MMQIQVVKEVFLVEALMNLPEIMIEEKQMKEQYYK